MPPPGVSSGVIPDDAVHANARNAVFPASQLPPTTVPCSLTAAAKLLGVSFRTLRYRLSKLGLSKEQDNGLD